MNKLYNKLDDYLCLIAMDYDIVKVCSHLLNFTNITTSNISNPLCISPELTRKIISQLLKYECIIPKGGCYVKLLWFSLYLKKVISNKTSKNEK